MDGSVMPIHYSNTPIQPERWYIESNYSENKSDSLPEDFLKANKLKFWFFWWIVINNYWNLSNKGCNLKHTVKYVFLVVLDDPQGAPHIIYNYKGQKITTSRNEAGWNAVYTAGKIIEKIGPILAINNHEVDNTHVVKKNN